ncbi:hypothetical protein [Sphingobacterium sp. UBA6320]|uniref:hypothetical protein n=1 Tax=Sphingobacterium sp. UBA6320 TaxID=1947510 RepID=UPI0025FE38BB|nr:hypothetical protein [Sphingobacterium sp. UBA6320]
MKSKRTRTSTENQMIIDVQKRMIDALRIVIASAGSLRYSAYEHLQVISNELKAIDPTLKTPQILDLKKDLDRIIAIAEKLNTACKIRFVSNNSQENFENIAFGIFQCNAALAIKPENEIYQEALRLNGHETNYSLLGEQVKFFDAVLDKARKSNHEAVAMISERRNVLESINVQPILVDEDGNIKVYDIAFERQEVEDTFCTD